MHILCTICSDLVNPAESLYVTKCGHLFHHQCLAQWIERSKSCPQCRNKVTDRCMFRMYPTVSNENSGEDAATLQSRLDDAMLQLRTQKTEQKELRDKLTAATQEASKKEELLKAAEKRLVSRDSAVSALREQLEYVKIQNRETQRLKEENEVLKKNMQTLNGLRELARIVLRCRAA
ncbi:E3 ubiquitin-protein ligase TRAIP-like [Leguminivora glycinivorella]|uniref:E3 ubiquitin-protein ligase TRAIP-like n=1 Tax=Leguminivora glycinivorella TaxID=1035111 RepID=UPI002010A23E|nr:E3 ubiquitin-protein ligase TRAIP-like [Leguminivora glycinivorella]